MEISKKEARRIALASQGLHQVRPFGTGKRAVANAISHLGYVQIDTISVTARAHHHVLWSRVPDYSPEHLLDLQKEERKIFEFWAHAAAYLPMEDYRFGIPLMEHFRNHHDPWPKSDKKTMKYVLDRIRADGPLRSRDFEAPTNANKTGWWDWKPAKLALQRLFFTGQLMISHREGFQRVYDVPERVLPADINTMAPSPEEYATYLIFNTIQAHGLVRASEISYLRRGMGTHVRKMLKELASESEITGVHVRGLKEPFYTTAEILGEPVRITKRIRLLSPFDNGVIQRQRLSDLFDFDYQIEVYVPKPKRKFGYYCLPILYGDRFIGRVDVKAERKRRELNLLHLHIEADKLPESCAEELASAFQAFAEFNNCDRVVIRKATPEAWANRIRGHLPGWL